MNKSKIERDANRFLRRTEDYKEARDSCDGRANYEIDFILAKCNNAIPLDVIAYASYDDYCISFHPYRSDSEPEDVHWSFTYEEDLFERLRDGFEIVSMPFATHHCIWQTITESPTVECSAGLQKYLAYCKEHDITSQKLRNLENYFGADLMKMYDGNTKAVNSRTKRHDDFNR